MRALRGCIWLHGWKATGWDHFGRVVAEIFLRILDMVKSFQGTASCMEGLQMIASRVGVFCGLGVLVV